METGKFSDTRVTENGLVFGVDAFIGELDIQKRAVSYFYISINPNGFE